MRINTGYSCISRHALHDDYLHSWSTGRAEEETGAAGYLKEFALFLPGKELNFYDLFSNTGSRLRHIILNDGGDHGFFKGLPLP